MTHRVLYVVSRFPKLSETFVVNEFDALSARFELRLVALVHTREQAADAAAERILRRAWMVSPASPRTFLANMRWLRRTPRRYLATWWTIGRGLRVRDARTAAETLVVAWQAARLAELAAAERIEHVHAHFAHHPTTAAWVVHRLTGIAFSFTAHANDLFRAPVLLERKGADTRFVIAISDFNRELLARAAPRRG